ncbi:MgtC/SapB family protein [Microbulbifer elongatus]|uniref:Protein MgtC n=1 Tax=Microbulbifer elongatus TaxID=86173 RepID=A0ABT1P0T0_9GAMM|nr:MgtC/SapB family protein [Microbulbifer elongatus]MCQ3828646.1 MgtC/SapB family protein [Microbulbifer elongatus]
MELFKDVDWLLVLDHIIYMAVAYLLALPIGWDREKHERTAGLRTFPLVAVAACGYTLVGFDVLTSTDAEGRVIEGLITGMGFIGGGAILKSVTDGGKSGRVQGTATAASLWATGAIGLAVATNRLEVAIVISLLTFLTLRVMHSAKSHFDGMDKGDNE